MQCVNCFKISGSEVIDPSLPVVDLTDGVDPVTLIYLSYNCGGTPPGENEIVDIDGGLYDTIPEGDMAWVAAYLPHTQFHQTHSMTVFWLTLQRETTLQQKHSAMS